jgi:hypothetical protein
MNRVRFIEHKGHRILLLDYSQLTDEREMLIMIARRRKVVSEQPPGSLLQLADVTGTQFTRAAMEEAKRAAVLDLPHVKRAAVVGASTERAQALLESAEVFAMRQWTRFDTREAALDWLVSGEETAAEQTAKAG